MIKSDSEDIYNVEVLLNVLFYSSKNPKNIKFQTNSKQHNCFLTVIIIRNISWASNQHISMISAGSCNTEDWCDDAENSALITGINYIWKNIQIENSYFKLY